MAYVKNAAGVSFNLEEGISANGDYYFDKLTLLYPNGYFLFGNSVKQAGHTATVTLWFEVAGVKTNLGAPQTATFGSPKVWPDEYTLTGVRGFTVSALTGVTYPEIDQ